MKRYFKPRSIPEALSFAAGLPGDYIYISGGTDLQIYRKQGLVKNEAIIDLSEIDNVNTVKIDADFLSLGAFITLSEIASSAKIKRLFPLLVEATLSVATPVIRKTATIGGNLLVKNRCTFYNQSQSWRDAIGSCMRDVGEICQVTGGKDKCFSRNVSDTVPALIALNATVIIQNRENKKELPLIDLFQPDGIKFHNHMDDDTILAEVRVPVVPLNWWYKKLRLRQSIDFTSLTIAATVDPKGVARVCLNGVSMSPVLIEGPLSSMTLEGLTREARKQCKTVDNDLMPLKYRREMINVYLKQWWETTRNE